MKEAKFEVDETSERTKKILGSTILAHTPNSVNSSLRNCYFDSFMYTDHLTKNKLSLQFRSPLREKTNNKEEYQYCFSLMKKTKKFHINEVKDRNYKHTPGNIQMEQYQEKQQIKIIKEEKQKKYAIRKFKEREQFMIDKKQLNKLLSRDRKFLHQSQNLSLHRSRDGSSEQDSKPLALPKEPKYEMGSKSMMNSILCEEYSTDTIVRRENFLKLPSNLNMVSRNSNSQGLSLNKKIQKNRKDLKRLRQIKGKGQQIDESDKEILQKFNRELRHEVTKNIQFLVDPNSYKLIGQIKNKNRIKQQNDSCKYKSSDSISQLKNNRKFSKIYQQFEKYSFNLDNLEEVPQKYRTKREIERNESQKMCETKNKLVRGIKEGNYFLVQIELSVNPSLLMYKQSKTLNNLLHLCIKHNQSQIFFMIIKKCEQNRVGLLLQENKYKKSPLQVLKIYKQFFERCKSHNQFSSVEKYLRKHNFSIK